MEINKHFLKSWGIKEIIDVPIRKDFYTLTAPLQKCHQNSANFQFMFGGKTVLGFAFYKFDNHIRVENHSIWKTPDNKFVDVSLGEFPDDSIKFAPLKTFDSFKEYYDVFHGFVLRSDTFTSRYFNRLEEHSYDWLKDKDFSDLVFRRKKSVTESDDWQSYIKERWEIYKHIICGN